MIVIRYKCKCDPYTGACIHVANTENSYLDFLSYSYVHDAVDFEIEKNNPACSDCGGGSETYAVPTIKLERFHKFREMSKGGSFGPGIFSNYDKSMLIYEVNGKTQIDYFDGTDVILRRYYQQNGVFIETFTRSTKKLELYNSTGAITTNLAQATTAKIFDFNGEYKTFELFADDEFVKSARLTGEYDRRDYGITLTYQVAASATVSNSAEKFKLNTISDSNKRTLTFQYLTGTKGGGYVVSSVTVPNGSSIIYNYEDGVDGELESVNYPDGTSSTFSSISGSNSSIKRIFEAGDGGTHRNKWIHLDNNFVSGAGGREGFDYFNQASLLVNAIERGNEGEKELSLDVFQSGSSNGRKIYEGGEKLRLSNIVSNRYFNSWDFDLTKEGDSKYFGSQESTYEKGDWKYYSGNAQGRMPLKYEENGLLFRYLYSANKAKTKKVYPDETFERWSYNQFNQPTRHRDRLGRVTHWEYNDQGNLLKKKVGLVAQPNGSAGETIPGMLCQIYDWTGGNLPTNFDGLTAVETVSVPNLTLDLSDREDTYALLFTGEIEIENEGEYTFFLSSDDGSKLYIDGVEVIDNDGSHGLREKSNEIPLLLTSGKHTIKVEFFEKYGAQQLFLKYQGLDTAGVKTDIPDSAYSHTSVEAELQESDETTDAYAEYSYTYYPNTGSEELTDNRYLLHTEIDANGNITTYEYTEDNQLESIITENDAGDGTIIKSYYDYDEVNKRLLSSSDAKGRTSHFYYDNRDRVVKIKYSDDSTELFFYGTGADSNLLVRSKDRNGNTTFFGYDSHGRPTTTIIAFGTMPANATSLSQETENTGDREHLKSTEVCTYLSGTGYKKTCTVDGELTEYFYDYRNRLVETKVHADNNSILSTKSTYHKNMFLFREDAYGRRTYYSYRLGSDASLIRTVQETLPNAFSASNFSHVDNLDRIITVEGNASYLITDFLKDVEGQTTQVTDPRGIKNAIVYDSRGRTTFQINDSEGLQQTRQTIYDANSNVVGIINPRFFEDGTLDGTVMTYTSRNLLETRTVARIYRAEGESNPPATSDDQATESFTYYIDGRAKDHTDFNGNTTTRVWKQCCGRLGVIAGPVFTDKGGVEVRKATIFQYDYYGNQTHTADLVIGASDDLPACCEYNPDNDSTIQEITTRYDARHRPIARTVWLSPITTTETDRLNPPIYGEDGAPDGVKGLTTQMEYFDEVITDPVNPLLSTLLSKLPVDVALGTNTDGSAVLSTNAEGEKSVSIQDGAGRTVASGMLSSEDGSLKTWQTVTYDKVVSNLLETTQTSALGFENKSYTDGAGRKRKSIDTEGNESTFKYDNNSNRISFRDANGVGRDCTFDNLNRDILCEDTEGSITEKKYDLNNNIIEMEDAKDNITSIAYDARNRRSSVTDRIDGTTSYIYDDNSNVESITDALGKETVYDYDSRNLQVKVTYADHLENAAVGTSGYGITKCDYDALGRKTRATDQKGEYVEYIYDQASRLTDRVYYLANEIEESRDTFDYDDASRLETATKGRYGNTISFTYDIIGRKKTETTTLALPGSADWESAKSFTTTYKTYDDDNRLKEVLYPTSVGNTQETRHKLEKGYTDRNQLKSLAFKGSSIISEIKYDEGMREKQRNFGNGIVTNKTYRDDNTYAAITSVSRPELSFEYETSTVDGYDANKNVLREYTGGVAANYSWDATFDDIDRLKTWTRTGSAGSLPASQDWTLDKIGNWDDVTRDGVFEDRTHNDAHEISSIASTGKPTTNPAWDVKGNLQFTPGAPVASDALVWDIDNHLSSYTKNGITTTFTYDALGRRLEKTTGSSSTLFISSGHQVVEEYSLSGATYNLERSYVYGSYIDDVIAKIEAPGSTGGSSTVLYYHSDRQFNIRGLTDSNGAVKELYAYSPYGKQIILDASGVERTGSAHNNNYGYTGRRLDTETGLWYFRARYFSNEMGRFISRDPLGYVDGMSLYGGYFAQHFAFDPYGLDWSFLASPEARRSYNEGRESMRQLGETIANTPSSNPVGTTLAQGLVAIANSQIAIDLLVHYINGNGLEKTLTNKEMKLIYPNVNLKMKNNFMKLLSAVKIRATQSNEYEYSEEITFSDHNIGNPETNTLGTFTINFKGILTINCKKSWKWHFVGEMNYYDEWDFLGKNPNRSDGGSFKTWVGYYFIDGTPYKVRSVDVALTQNYDDKDAAIDWK